MLFKNKLLWLDLGVFSGYIVAVSVAVVHHEPWADEAQAWLVARDLPFWKMLLSEMRYEISPGLWHVLLWVAQHVFHAPYFALNWIGAVLAMGGAGVLIFCAPFPRPVRYVISSSYFVAYQYAVIARPYVMLLLFGGIAAVFYRRRAPIPLAIAIALLCGGSLHGAILGGAITLGAAWHVLVKRDWPVGQARPRYLVAAAIVMVAGLMVVVIARPAPDAGGEVLSVFSIAHLDTLTSLLGATIVAPWGIGAFLVLVFAVFAVRSAEGIVFVAGVGGLIAFECLLYALPHHLGAIVVALIVSLWIAWPHQQRFNPETAMTALVLGSMFAIQTAWAVSAWRNDYVAPYSGSKDAATYLKRVGADHRRIFGFCYEAVSIQAYFEHSIFENWPTGYLHLSKSSYENVKTLEGNPTYDYLVIPVLHGDDDPYEPALRTRGYVPVHVSSGREFFGLGIWQSETYVIYRRAF